MDKEIKKRLREIVGEDNFTDCLIDLVSYSYDASDNFSRPQAAVWPSSTEQVARIMRLAWEREIPVTPRGAGTGLAGSAVPAAGGLVMDLSRMNRILEIRIPDRLVVLEPGVVYEDLDRALAPYGFFFPPDPASGKVCTIGGNVATNAGGIRGAKYGVTRDYVLALEVVLADGRILQTGSSCMKSVSGYDLTRLFVGSEGTLGVITRITLKISPRPKASSTATAVFSDLSDAGRAVSDIMHSGVIPSVLEILDERALKVLREHGGFALPEAKAMILTETDGYTQAEAEAQMERILEVFSKNKAAAVEQASSPADAQSLWRVRKSVGSVAAKLRPANISEDVAVPISRVPDLLTGISRIASEMDIPFVIFGHAGDGNIHPRLMYDPARPEQSRAVHLAAEAIFRLACGLGGTLTGEHGIGLSKAPYMEIEHSSVSLEIMRVIKASLDPKNILNPGKMRL
jgi:glycolate oxidase